MGATLAPEKILKQVADLWVNEHAEGGAGTGVLRACSLTLVVVAAEDEDAAGLSETLAALMPLHPARAIVIRPSPNQPLGAHVAAHCWIPFGQKHQVCSEEIEITGSEGALDDIFSVVSPIRAPDLPVILWCRNRALFESASIARHAKLASRLIVDSAALGDPRQAFGLLSNLVAGGLRIGDLSWTGLTRWREMLSQVFENRKYAAHLPQMTQVTVTYGGSAAPACARYMGAWILDSLRQTGAQPKLDFAAEPTGGEEQLLAVELSSDSFHVTLARQGETLCVSVDDLTHCTNLPVTKDHLLMSEELEILGRDPVFEQVLRVAIEL
ncbi:MAG: glucose-6-phosphate dehydrogenase assembly protein OpcA [Acidobacteriia bacterium]|nr:glucose-6-phosphate dehydrogenase assembly protein OpcA [Terriglobia bacterium]